MERGKKKLRCTTTMRTEVVSEGVGVGGCRDDGRRKGRVRERLELVGFLVSPLFWWDIFQLRE